MIDWDRVRELRREIGADHFDEVVALFFGEADEAIARLSGNEGALALSSDLHSLKGAALNLGFGRLAALCDKEERRAAVGDLGLDLDAVRSAYAEARHAFDQGTAAAFAA